jgi:hypothetical protein
MGLVLNDQTIRTALATAGEHLHLDRGVEILIVGGAAGVLTGALPAGWSTADVDVIHFRLSQDREAVLAAAEEAAQLLSLPPSWISEDVGLFTWTLPQGWETRRVKVGSYGQLQVYAAGRFDLIAMKFLAHRERDLLHLTHLRVTPEELRSVDAYLESLAAEHAEEAGRIEMARQYVANWAG